MNPIDILLDNQALPNLVDKLDNTQREELARLVKFGYDIDDASRKEWKEQTKEGLKIAEQIMETKSWPWDGASNVKFPLIAISAIQFAARAYPSIIQGDKVVKAKVVGKDPEGKKAEKAQRVSNHMSWQLLDKMQGWDEDTDKLLHVLPVVGTVFRKTYYDELTRANVSELCLPLDVVVHMKTANFTRCRRVSHKVWWYKNEVIEMERAGLYTDKGASYFEDNDDEDLAELFIEQHRWYDLDKDGYEEPYIVTVHEASGELVRVVSRYDADGIQVTEKGKIKRIEPVQYFTPFFFIPAASGKFYAMGFAHLLGGINEALSTIINQLIDAGTMANLGGGFLGRGARTGKGALRFSPGEWKPIDIMGGVLRDNIVPLPIRDPSTALFQLLGTLHSIGRELSSVSETMAGESPSQNTPATTTLAVIEQGMMVFSGINLRIFRSLTSEYGKIRRLNFLYMDEEEAFRVQDDAEFTAFKSDYDKSDYDVYPVADPSMASSAQRLARARALLETVDRVPTPEGKLEILWRFYEALQIENIERILPKGEDGKISVPQPPPDPKALELQLKATDSMHAEGRAQQKLPLELQKMEEEINQIKALTVKAMADAESQPILNQLQAINDMVASMHNQTKLEIEREKIGVANAKGNSSADGSGGTGAPNNQEAPQVPGGVGAGAVGPDGSGGLVPGGQPGGDGFDDSAASGGDEGTAPYPEGVRRS